MGMKRVSDVPTILPADAPPAEIVDPTRVRVEVLTVSKRAAQAEFRVRLDTAEVWYREHLVAVFDREKLRAWLQSPWRWVAEGEVVLSVDPRSAGDRIAIGLQDVAAWTLSPKELAALRVRV